MSRSGYSCDLGSRELNLWRATVERSIRGKRGQAFLREMVAALDAMPVKELVDGDIVRDEQHVCAIGSVALARKLNVKEIDPSDRDAVGQTFGIAPALAAEIAFENDDDFGYGDKTPADRWKRMRSWAASKLLPAVPTGREGSE